MQESLLRLMSLCLRNNCVCVINAVTVSLCFGAGLRVHKYCCCCYCFFFHSVCCYWRAYKILLTELFVCDDKEELNIYFLYRLIYVCCLNSYNHLLFIGFKPKKSRIRHEMFKLGKHHENFFLFLLVVSSFFSSKFHTSLRFLSVDKLIFDMKIFT